MENSAKISKSRRQPPMISHPPRLHWLFVKISLLEYSDSTDSTDGSQTGSGTPKAQPYSPPKRGSGFNKLDSVDSTSILSHPFQKVNPRDHSPTHSWGQKFSLLFLKFILVLLFHLLFFHGGLFLFFKGLEWPSPSPPSPERAPSRARLVVNARCARIPSDAARDCRADWSNLGRLNVTEQVRHVHVVLREVSCVSTACESPRLPPSFRSPPLILAEEPQLYPTPNSSKLASPSWRMRCPGLDRTGTQSSGKLVRLRRSPSRVRAPVPESKSKQRRMTLRESSMD